MSKRPATPKLAIVCSQVLGWLPAKMFDRKTIEVARDHSRNCTHQLILDGKDVLQVTVVTLGPEMIAGRDLDKLRGHTHPITRFPYAALNHVVRAQFPPHLFH